MRKVLTIVLAVALLLGLSMPAMAFTSDSEADDDSIPYELKIYLVEYDDNDFFGITTLPESDRGYAKNEIVAAVVELYVPDDEEITDEEYGTLVFGGENVDLNVQDNYSGVDISIESSSNVTTEATVTLDTMLNSDDEIQINITSMPGEQTYRWLFFAKVTDDDASLYAKLIDIDTSHLQMQIGFSVRVTLSGVEYRIIKEYDAGEVVDYRITNDEDGNVIRLYIDEDNKTTGMGIRPEELMIDDPDSIDPADLLYVEYAMGVNTKNELGVVDPANPAKFLSTDSDEYEAVMDVYEDVVVDVFGLDYFRIGNYLRDSFFEDLVSPDTLVATVDIEPWTAYVTVPDNIVVDPPKTGDVASILGFVMVALSGAGVVALRKRG